MQLKGPLSHSHIGHELLYAPRYASTYSVVFRASVRTPPVAKSPDTNTQKEKKSGRPIPEYARRFFHHRSLGPERTIEGDSGSLVFTV